MRPSLFVGLLLVVALCCVASVPCATASPVLYVSFHGGNDGVNNINSYSLTGDLVKSNVLNGDTSSELRSAVIRDDGSLLVCNAHKTDSRLSVFSACAADGSRSYVSDFATTHLAHPYGLAIGLDAAKGDEVVWASNQNTCDVVQFSGKSGVFQSQVGQLGTDEIRSIAYDNVTAVLYVADKDQNAVLAYNTKTATWDKSLSFQNVPTPIGLYLDPNRRLLFAGSNDDKGADGSGVFAWDLVTRSLVQTFRHKNLQHPAGIVSIWDNVFIVSQKAGTLMRFSLASGKHLDTPIKAFPDTPEQVLLSDC